MQTDELGRPVALEMATHRIANPFMQFRRRLDDRLSDGTGGNFEGSKCASSPPSL
jgi:hypothetical protein